MKRIGLYPGSFDPFHIGHLDVARQAKRVFDSVFILRAVNPEKVKAAADLPSQFLQDEGYGVLSFDGLITNFIKEWEAKNHDVTLIRGLRSGADLAYEQNLVAFMRNMHPEIKVVFFLCDPKYQHISSSALRGIRLFSEEEYRKYALG